MWRSPQRCPVEAEGWLARTAEAFPEQPIGRRLLLRPTHPPPAPTRGRILLRIDAGLAFGSGEHASTRGCLLALNAWRRGGRVGIGGDGRVSSILVLDRGCLASMLLRGSSGRWC